MTWEFPFPVDGTEINQRKKVPFSMAVITKKQEKKVGTTDSISAFPEQTLQALENNFILPDIPTSVREKYFEACVLLDNGAP